MAIISKRVGLINRPEFNELITGYNQLSQQTLNVKDYNAKGDGVNDDTAEIQAAIDYLTLNGGGTLFIPKGYYKISATLNVGRPLYSTYALFTNRNGTIDRNTLDLYKITANWTYNGQLNDVDIVFDAGAVLFTSSSWTPAVKSPVIAYNLRTRPADTGRGGIYNACIVSAAKLQNGEYNQDAGGTSPISNNFIGIYAEGACKRIIKTFISGINDGVITADAYWTTISDYTFHYGDGWGLNVFDGNALFINNLLFYVCRGGLIFDGHASQVQGIHTETVLNDLWITGSDCCVFGPGYLEDVGSADGTGLVSVKTGVTQDGNEVISSRFVGLRVAGTRPNKTAFRFWATRSCIVEGCRAYSSPVVFDALSYIQEINTDFPMTAPSGVRIKSSAARTIWANFEPTGTQSTVNGPWMFHIENLDLGTINAGATFTHNLTMPTSMNAVNYLAAYVTTNTAVGLVEIIINTKQGNSVPKNIEITFYNPTASPIVVGMKNFNVVVFSGGA